LLLNIYKVTNNIKNKINQLINGRLLNNRYNNNRNKLIVKINNKNNNS